MTIAKPRERKQVKRVFHGLSTHFLKCEIVSPNIFRWFFHFESMKFQIIKMQITELVQIGFPIYHWKGFEM